MSVFAKILARPILCPASYCALILVAFAPSQAKAVNEVAMGLSAVEYGGAIGSLLLTDYESTRKIISSSDSFVSLAKRIQAQINEGKSTSKVVGSYFNMQTAALSYAAAIDPEPLSKSTAAVAAWGSKLAGDAISQSILDKAQEDARSILAQGLKETRLTDAQLRAITPKQLRARVRDLQIGGRKMRDILQDNPKALEILEAESADLAANIGVENIARTAAIGTDVNLVRSKLNGLSKNIAAYQNEMKERMTRVEGESRSATEFHQCCQCQA